MASTRRVSLLLFSALLVLSSTFEVQAKRVLLPAGTTWANLAWGWDQGGKDSTTGRKFVLVDVDEVTTQQIANYHKNGQIVGCYFSVGTIETWRPDYKPNKASWDSLVVGQDSQWDEGWLSLATEKRSLLQSLMLNRIQKAAAKGCDAIEGDNVECYGIGVCYKGMKMSASAVKPLEISYVNWLASTSQGLGMAYLLKNALGIVPDVLNNVDGHINEQCLQYKECATLSPFIKQNKAVFQVEYTTKNNPCANAYQKYGLSTKYCAGSASNGLCTKGSWINCQPAQNPLPPTTYTN